MLYRYTEEQKATAKRHIKTISSRDIFELSNTGDFSKYAFVGEPDGRESPKSTIATWAFDSAIDTGPVLLVGLTTPRVT